MHDTTDAPNTGRESAARLIRAAFERARRGGKADWQTMTIAVLKNRLLSESGGAFDEHAYGARSMSAFVEAFPDLLRLDREGPYPLVTLVEGEREPLARLANDEGSHRLRPDLWRAVFDYRGGHTYVWDGSRAVAVPEDDGQLGSPLPTIGEAELDAWRGRFAEEHRKDISEAEQAQLDRWRDHRLPTTLLPAPLRRLWNRELTARAIERLEHWFAENGLPVPADLASAVTPTAKESPETAHLRRFVQSCVGRMTLNELRLLQLRAPAVARTVGSDDLKRCGACQAP